MSVEIDILEAIADAIKAARPAEDVAVELNAKLWRKHLAAIGRIVIVPGEESAAPFTDATNLYTFPVDVVIQIPLPTNKEDPDEAPRENFDRRQAVLDVWNEDGDLREAVLGGCAVWNGFKPRPLWEADHVHAQAQFTAVITPIYQFER